MKYLTIKAFFCCIFFLLLSGCTTMQNGPAPYVPLNSNEEKLLEQSRKDIFPDDVRRYPGRFAQTLVGWTGVIKNIKFRAGVSSQIAIITIQHRYFDWIEDHGAQPEKYFLSPRGEGMFALAWVDDMTEEAMQFMQSLNVGDMIVAYGYPSQTKNTVVALSPIQNIRAFPKTMYRSDVADYGRPGQPVRLLRRAY